MKIALVVGCMLTVWKAVMAKETVEGRRFPCQSWQGVTGTALYAMAKVAGELLDDLLDPYPSFSTNQPLQINLFHVFYL